VLFVGSTYGSDGITVAVRIGFDDNRSLGGMETGGKAALPVFREVMLKTDQAKLVGPHPTACRLPAQRWAYERVKNVCRKQSSNCVQNRRRLGQFPINRA